MKQSFLWLINCYFLLSFPLHGSSFQIQHVKRRMASITRHPVTRTTASSSCPSISRLNLLTGDDTMTNTASLVHQASVSSSTLLGADVESWRQYVPLVVIGAVLVDILLGSPLANMALKPMKAEAEAGGSAATTEEQRTAEQDVIHKSRERVDSDAVAQAALDKATNSLELKQFLEERKTDWDRMEEIRKKMDADMQDIDDELEARQKKLSKKK